MNKLIALICLMLCAGVASAQKAPARAPYDCQYMKEAPYGVMDWVHSARIKAGTGTESHFVPYNSEAAQALWLDATTVRQVETTQPVAGRKTSFNMVYNEKGWYIYIQCDEPDIQNFIDQGKDITLELFFVPGLAKVPYYQMLIHQLGHRVEYIDWGTASRDYRSLKGRITVESLALDKGVGTFLFIPWEVVYDWVPFQGDTWRFTFMRWGGESVTWGGKVHDTGNFGLVRFDKPSAEVATAIRKRILHDAWFTFQRTAAQAARHWQDPEVGDPTFYEKALQPAIDRYQAAGQALGDPKTWNEATVRDSAPLAKDLMEFSYEIQTLRAQYLMNNLFESAGQAVNR